MRAQKQSNPPSFAREQQLAAEALSSPSAFLLALNEVNLGVESFENAAPRDLLFVLARLSEEDKLDIVDVHSPGRLSAWVKGAGLRDFFAATLRLAKELPEDPWTLQDLIRADVQAWAADLKRAKGEGAP